MHRDGDLQIKLENAGIEHKLNAYDPAIEVPKVGMLSKVIRMVLGSKKKAPEVKKDETVQKKEGEEGDQIKKE